MGLLNGNQPEPPGARGFEVGLVGSNQPEPPGASERTGLGLLKQPEPPGASEGTELGLLGSKQPHRPEPPAEQSWLATAAPVPYARAPVRRTAAGSVCGRSQRQPSTTQLGSGRTELEGQSTLPMSDSSVPASRPPPAGPPDYPGPKHPVQVKAKLVEASPDSETAVTLRLGPDGMRVQRLGAGAVGGCCGAPAAAGRVLHHWTLDALLDVQKTTVRQVDDGVEVAVREDGAVRKHRFVTRQGRNEQKKKAANLTLCLAWNQYAVLPRHYKDWSDQKQKEYVEDLHRIRREKDTERVRATERAAKLDAEMTELFSAVDRGMQQHEYDSVSKAMQEIWDGAEQDDVHPQQRAEIKRKHAFRQATIEDAASALGDAASKSFETAKRRTARDLKIDPRTPTDYGELSVDLDRIRSMDAAFQGHRAISSPAQDALSNKYEDLKVQLDAHLTDLVKRASDPFSQATPQAVVGFIGRLETIATYETMEQHVPHGCEGPTKRLSAMWSKFEERVEKLNATCSPLAPSSPLQRTTTRSDTENVEALARTLGQLQEYVSALEEIRCAEPGVEEGVPGEARQLLRTSTSISPHTAAGQKNAKRLQDSIRCWIEGHRVRLNEICRALRSSGEILAEDQDRADENYTRALGQLQHALTKLDRWAETLDDFAGGCFRREHTALAETARKFLTDKKIAFDDSLNSGKPAEAEEIMAMIQHLDTVYILESEAQRLLPGMKERLMVTRDNTEKRAHELFEEENFVALKDFMLDLKASPPESIKFKAFEKLQSWLVSQLRQQYRKAKQELEDPTPRGVSTLVQSTQFLTTAEPLDECVDGADCGGWRLELQADVQKVCTSLKQEVVSKAEAWQLSTADAIVTHLRLYTKCPGCESEALDEALKAIDSALASLPDAMYAALGTQGTEPQPRQIDTIVNGLQAAVDSCDQSAAALQANFDAYKTKLAECAHAIKTVVDEHIRQWEASLNTCNVEGAHTTCRRLEILNKAQAVERLAEHPIDVALISRRLSETKEKVMSAKYLRDTRREALDKNLSGLKRVDEGAFHAGWESLISQLGRSKDQRLGDLDNPARLTEQQVFQSLKQDLEDLGTFQVVLQPHADTAQLRHLRQELLSGWVRCMSRVCSPERRHELRDVTSEATCIQDCVSLDGDERPQVNEAVKKFNEARKAGGEYVEKLVRVYREVMEIDCTEPTTLESVDSNAGKRRLTDCLRSLKEDESLVTSEHGDVSYEHAVQHLEQTIRKARDVAKSALPVHSSAWLQPSSTREEDLGLVARCSEGLQCLSDVSEGGIDQEALSALDEIKAAVSSQLRDLCDRGDQYFTTGDFLAVNEVLTTLQCTQRFLKPLNRFGDILRECSDIGFVTKMQDKVSNKKDALIEKVKRMDGCVDVAALASDLLELYHAPSEIESPQLKETALRSMDVVLKEAEKKEHTLTGKKLNYAKLADHLSADESGKGGTIISKLHAFKKWQHDQFIRATAGASPEKSIPEIVRLNKYSEQQQAALQRCWDVYYAKYESMLKRHHGNTDVRAMVEETTKDKSNVVETIAGICAVWSLAGLSKEEESGSIVQPHCCQILSIFVLLGLQDASEMSSDGHLIQVKTGQGKSVLLGVLATLLAVMGYDVDCVCYSEYLSSRDEESFAAVFNAFNVTDSVKYGTFNGLAEASINAKGDVRQLTNDVLLKNGEASDLPEPAERQKILLIDEVCSHSPDCHFLHSSVLRLRCCSWSLAHRWTSSFPTPFSAKPICR